MRKTSFIFLIAVLLNACSAGKHYFNKRIDHPESEINTAHLTEAKLENEKPFCLPIARAEELKPEAMDLDSAAPSKTPEAPVKTKTLHYAKQVPSVRSVSKNMERLQPVKKGKPVVASDIDIDGFGVVLLIIVGVFLLVFLISLLLGYTAGQAALYGLMAILILLIIGLILLLRNNDDDDDNTDGDD